MSQQLHKEAVDRVQAACRELKAARQALHRCPAGPLRDELASELRAACNETRKRLSREARAAAQHSEIAIYEAQNREDARARAENRKPRLISTMADITDKA